MRERAGSATTPAARCRNWRRGSFTVISPQRSCQTPKLYKRPCTRKGYVSFWHLADNPTTPAFVRFWHLADKPTAPAFVAYWTNNVTAQVRIGRSRGPQGC